MTAARKSTTPTSIAILSPECQQTGCQRQEQSPIHRRGIKK
jgi:hypothetical protein